MFKEHCRKETYSIASLITFANYSEERIGNFVFYLIDPVRVTACFQQTRGFKG